MQQINSINRIIKVPDGFSLVKTKARLYYLKCASGTDSSVVKVNNQTLDFNRYSDGFYDFEIDLSTITDRQILLEHAIAYGTAPSNTIIIKKLTIAYNSDNLIQKDIVNTVKFVSEIPKVDKPIYFPSAKITGNSEKIVFNPVNHAIKKIVKIKCFASYSELIGNAEITIDGYPVYLRTGTTELIKKSEVIFETTNDNLEIKVSDKASLTIFEVGRWTVQGNLTNDKFFPILNGMPYRVIAQNQLLNIGIINKAKLIVEHTGGQLGQVSLKTLFKNQNNPNGIFNFRLSNDNSMPNKKYINKNQIDKNSFSLENKKIKDIVNNTINNRYNVIFDSTLNSGSTSTTIADDCKLIKYDDGYIEITYPTDDTIINIFELSDIKNWDELNSLELTIE